MCLFFFRMVSWKTDAIIKPDIEMFQDESWKRIYLGSENIKAQDHESQKNIADMGLCTLAGASFLVVLAQDCGSPMCAHV